MEDLARRADLSVDTIRFYQKRRLLPPPERSGRVAWYGPEHLERLARIRELRGRGLTLALIGRVLDGELDPTDAPLAAAVVRADAEAPEEFLTLAELAERSGVPVALLEAVARENLLVARVHDGEARYTTADIAIVQQGLRPPRAGPPAPRPARARARSPRDDARHRGDRGRPVRSLRARAAARVRPPRRREGRAARRGVPGVAARGHHARRAPLPAGAARGRAGAPRVGRRRSRARGRERRRRRAASRAGRREPRRPAPGLARPPRPRRQATRRRGDVRPDRAALRRAEPAAHVPHGRRAGAARRSHALALPRGARVLDLACGTGDLCRTLARRRSPSRSASTSRPACCAPRAPTRRSCAADALRLPFADANVRRHHVRIRAAQLRGARTGARRVRPGAPARAGGSRCSTSPNPRARSSASVHGAWFRHVVPFVGGLVSDRAAYRYLPASTAYLPPLPELLALVGDAGIVDVSRRTLGFGAAQLITGTRADDDLRPLPAIRSAARGAQLRDRRRRSTCSTTTRPTGSRGSTATTASWPSGVAAVVAPADAAAFLATIDHVVDRRRFPARRSAGGRRAAVRAASGELVVPALIVGRDADGPGGAPRSIDVDAPTRSFVRSTTPRRRSSRVSADDHARAVARDGRAGARRHRPRRAREGRARPRGRHRRRPCRSTFPRVLAYLRRSQPGCIVYADRGFVGASPELLVRKTGADVTVAPARRNRHRHRGARALGQGRARAPARRRRGRPVARAGSAPTCAPTARRRSSSPTSAISRRPSPPAPMPRTTSVTDLVAALHPDSGRRGHAPPGRARRDRGAGTGRRAGATRVRAAGSTATATASSSSRCAAARSTARAPSSTRAPASSPVPIPTRSGSRRSRSSRRCCKPWFGRNRRRRARASSRSPASTSSGRNTMTMTQPTSAATGSTSCKNRCPTEPIAVGRQRRVLLAEQHQRRVERDRPRQQVRPAQREQRERGERVPGHDPRARDEERRRARPRSRARGCRATCAAPR